MPNPILSLDVRYNLSVTIAEFRVIQQALSAAGGARAFPVESRAEALALQARLFDAREKQVAAWSASIVKANGETPPTAGGGAR